MLLFFPSVFDHTNENSQPLCLVTGKIKGAWSFRDESEEKRGRVVSSGKMQYNLIQHPNESAIIDPERWCK